MEMGIFCPPRTVQHQNCLYRESCRLEAQQDSEVQMERKNMPDKTDFISHCYRGLYLQDLNPVYMKWNIYGSIYIYSIYTYIQVRFNFKATANLFIL